MKRIIAVVAAGVVLLTGCAQVNSAASIGKVKVTVGTVQKSVNSILSERKKVATAGMTLESGDALNRAQIRFYVIAELLKQLAIEKKVSITDAELSARVANVIKQVGGTKVLPRSLVGAGIAPDDLSMYFKSVLYSEKLAAMAEKNGFTTANVGGEIQKEIISTAYRLGVVINPRYGKWDAANATVVAPDPAAGAVTKP